MAPYGINHKTYLSAYTPIQTLHYSAAHSDVFAYSPTCGGNIIDIVTKCAPTTHLISLCSGEYGLVGARVSLYTASCLDDSLRRCSQVFR